MIDDETEVRELLCEILSTAKHRVEAVASGRDALLRMHAHDYDVIVSDIRMPDMDGIALFDEIRRRWPERTGRVVFITGDTLSPSLREFAQSGHFPVIEKPFAPSELRRMVAEVAAESDRRARA